MAEIYTFSARDILEFMNIAGLGMAGEATDFCSRLYVCVNEREGDCRKKHHVSGDEFKYMGSVIQTNEECSRECRKEYRQRERVV